MICLGLHSDSQSASSKDIAIVLKVSGDAQHKSGRRNWNKLKKGRHLNSGDQVKTGSESMVSVIFTDDRSMMKIRSDSEVTFRGERKKAGIIKKLRMNFGQFWANINPQGAGFSLETPSGVAAVRGTEFYSIVDSNGNTSIIGVDGLVALFNKYGRVLVGKGQTGTLPKDGEPTLEKTENWDGWADSEDGTGNLQIEFEDESGNVKKRLNIDYEKQ